MPQVFARRLRGPLVLLLFLGLGLIFSCKNAAFLRLVAGNDDFYCGLQLWAIRCLRGGWLKTSGTASASPRLTPRRTAWMTGEYRGCHPENKLASATDSIGPSDGLHWKTFARANRNLHGVVLRLIMV